MLKQTSAPTFEVDLGANVSVNTLTVGPVFDFVEPDITSLDCSEDFVLKLFSKIIPPLLCNINALLYPW